MSAACAAGLHEFYAGLCIACNQPDSCRAPAGLVSAVEVTGTLTPTVRDHGPGSSSVAAAPDATLDDHPQRTQR